MTTPSGDALRKVLAPGDPDARMSAYYYSFEPTGIGIVDGILSAVAQAGKSYHGTDMWAEEQDPRYGDPRSHEQRIQDAANAAAAALRELTPGGQ